MRVKKDTKEILVFIYTSKMSLPTLEEEPELLEEESETIQEKHEISNVIDVTEVQEDNHVQEESTQTDPHVYIQLPDSIMEYQDYTKKKAHTLWKYAKSRATTYIHKIKAVPKEDYKTILHSIKNIDVQPQKESSIDSLDNDL